MIFLYAVLAAVMGALLVYKFRQFKTEAVQLAIYARVSAALGAAFEDDRITYDDYVHCLNIAREAYNSVVTSKKRKMLLIKVDRKTVTESPTPPRTTPS